MTAGDPATRTNQLFLLDISDLSATTGIPDVTAAVPDRQHSVNAERH